MTTIIFSNIRADLLRHRHHYVAEWRARRGPTIWIDSLGSRNPRFRDLRRLRGEGAGQTRSNALVGVTVVAGGTLPLHGSAAVYEWNVRRLEKRLFRLGLVPEETLAWVYLAHPVINALLMRHHWRRIVFDLCDDIGDIRNVHRCVLDAESKLLELADIVLASSEELVEKAHRYRSNGVHYVPNGVNSAQFLNLGSGSGGVRTISYIGSVFEWFDEDLVSAVAARRSDLRFRIVGPVRRPLRRLARLDNVEIVGPVPASDVPREIERSDLCMIPFRAGPLTEATDPLKLYETLAAGRPVLATYLTQPDRFAPAVRVERSPDGWLAAIHDLERGDWSFDAEAMRERVRRDHDWNRRFETMEYLVDGATG